MPVLKATASTPPSRSARHCFQRIAIGIVDPAVEEMPGELAIRIALKGGGGVERRSDRAGGRVHMPPGVDAKRLKLLVRIRLRCHTQSLLRGPSLTRPPLSRQQTEAYPLDNYPRLFPYLNGVLLFSPASSPLMERSSMPKLSVVAIPVRDEANGLAGCLAALARQSVPADHVVLLLNNCTDRTADVVRAITQGAPSAPHHRKQPGWVPCQRRRRTRHSR